MQEFLIMGFQKQFIFPCFLFISTLSHLFLSSSQVGGVSKGIKQYLFLMNFFLTLNLLLKCKPFTQSGNRSELVSARAPGTCESSGRKKYFLSSSQNKEQIEGGYLAPGLVLTLTNFIQESNIISFIVASSIKNIK